MTRSYQYSSRIIHIRTPTYPLLRTNKTIFDSHVRTKEVQHSHLICYKRQECEEWCELTFDLALKFARSLVKILLTHPWQTVARSLG